MLTPDPETTVSVRCDDGARGAAVAGHVVLAMAARAGLPPLAADRIRADIAVAVAACAGPLELACGAGDAGLTVIVTAPAKQVAEMAGLLEAHRPQVAHERLELRLRRTQLRLA